MNASLMAQAHRTDGCCLGTISIEVLGIINDYAVGDNHFSFFTRQFNKRPTAQDIIVAKQMAFNEQ